MADRAQFINFENMLESLDEANDRLMRKRAINNTTLATEKGDQPLVNYNIRVMEKYLKEAIITSRASVTEDSKPISLNNSTFVKEGETDPELAF